MIKFKNVLKNFLAFQNKKTCMITFEVKNGLFTIYSSIGVSGDNIAQLRYRIDRVDSADFSLTTDIKDLKDAIKMHKDDIVLDGKNIIFGEMKFELDDCGGVSIVEFLDGESFKYAFDREDLKVKVETANLYKSFDSQRFQFVCFDFNNSEINVVSTNSSRMSVKKFVGMTCEDQFQDVLFVDLLEGMLNEKDSDTVRYLRKEIKDKNDVIVDKIVQFNMGPWSYACKGLNRFPDYRSIIDCCVREFQFTLDVKKFNTALKMAKPLVSGDNCLIMVLEGDKIKFTKSDYSTGITIDGAVINAPMYQQRHRLLFAHYILKELFTGMKNGQFTFHYSVKKGQKGIMIWSSDAGVYMMSRSVEDGIVQDICEETENKGGENNG